MVTSPLNPSLCHCEQPSCLLGSVFLFPSTAFPSRSHLPIPFSKAIPHLLVSLVCSLGSFGMPRTPAPSAGSNSGPAPEAPTSSPAPPATSSPTGASSAQQQLMQQMIQLLAGSGSSQVHGAAGRVLEPPFPSCGIKGHSRVETAKQALVSARPGFRPWSPTF